MHRCADAVAVHAKVHAKQIKKEQKMKKHTAGQQAKRLLFCPHLSVAQWIEQYAPTVCAQVQFLSDRPA